ncbi:P-loop containing nucleoside triphosphate hydrolase protein, partial [Blyttiomyces helicus]
MLLRIARRARIPRYRLVPPRPHQTNPRLARQLLTTPAARLLTPAADANVVPEPASVPNTPAEASRTPEGGEDAPVTEINAASAVRPVAPESSAKVVEAVQGTGTASAAPADAAPSFGKTLEPVQTESVSDPPADPPASVAHTAVGEEGAAVSDPSAASDPSAVSAVPAEGPTSSASTVQEAPLVAPESFAKVVEAVQETSAASAVPADAAPSFAQTLEAVEKESVPDLSAESAVAVDAPASVARITVGVEEAAASAVPVDGTTSSTQTVGVAPLSQPSAASAALADALQSIAEATAAVRPPSIPEPGAAPAVLAAPPNPPTSSPQIVAEAPLSQPSVASAAFAGALQSIAETTAAVEPPSIPEPGEASAVPAVPSNPPTSSAQPVTEAPLSQPSAASAALADVPQSIAEVTAAVEPPSVPEFSASPAVPAETVAQTPKETEQEVIELVTFDALGMHPKLVRNLEAAGFKNPVEIQRKASSKLIEGLNATITAETGAGKTIGKVCDIMTHSKVCRNDGPYLAPLVSRLLTTKPHTPRPKTASLSPRLLIIVPNADLSYQLLRVLRDLIPGLGLSAVTLPTPTDVPASRFAKPAILVATPAAFKIQAGGSLPSMMKLMGRTGIIVVDEADQIAASSIGQEVLSAAAAVRKRRLEEGLEPLQTVFVAATLPRDNMRDSRSGRHDLER